METERRVGEIGFGKLLFAGRKVLFFCDFSRSEKQLVHFVVIFGRGGAFMPWPR